MANPPPLSAPSKRPFYLALALFAAMAFGMMRGCSGLAVMTVLHEDGSDIGTQCEPEVAAADGTTNADDAARVKALCEAWLTALSEARARVFPLSIAALLLGYGAAFFAARARRGRPAARPLLVQLLVAQAALAIVAYVLEPDIRRAEREFDVAKATALQRARLPDSADGREIVRMLETVTKAEAPFVLVLGEIANFLIILALTRPRARAFFEATPDPASPR